MLARIQAAQVTWLNVRLTLSFTDAARAAVNDDLVSALLVGGVLGANVQPPEATPNDLTCFLQPGGVPDELRRPVNATSMAQSLGIPQETARVKLAALHKSGILERREDGYILNSTAILSEPLRSALNAFLIAISEFVEGLAAIEAFGLSCGDALATPQWQKAGVSIRLVNAHILRGIDYATDLNSTSSVMTRFVQLGIAHLTGSALRLLAFMPLDGGALAQSITHSGPVSIAALARFLRLPEETVRRHVSILEQGGAVVRVAGGRDMALSNPELVARWLDFQGRASVSTRHLVNRFRSAGLIGSSTHCSATQA